MFRETGAKNFKKFRIAGFKKPKKDLTAETQRSQRKTVYICREIPANIRFLYKICKVRINTSAAPHEPEGSSTSCWEPTPNTALVVCRLKKLKPFGNMKCGAPDRGWKQLPQKQSFPRRRESRSSNPFLTGCFILLCPAPFFFSLCDSGHPCSSPLRTRFVPEFPSLPATIK